MSILSAENLSKKFKLREVVKNISFELRSGEVVGLLGPNGAGKTTAFYMVVGLIRADKGRVMLDGKDLTDLPMFMRARQGVGYLPQEASIFRKLTVAKNILAILETREELDRADRERLLEELLEDLVRGRIEGLARDHVVAALHESEDRARDGAHARCGGGAVSGGVAGSR